MVELLIERGADVNDRDRNGQTPLHCLLKGDTSVAHVLIKRGANLEARDNRAGRTPLHLGANFSSLSAVQNLAQAWTSRVVFGKAQLQMVVILVQNFQKIFDFDCLKFLALIFYLLLVILLNNAV